MTVQWWDDDAYDAKQYLISGPEKNKITTLRIICHLQRLQPQVLDKWISTKCWSAPPPPVISY